METIKRTNRIRGLLLLLVAVFALNTAVVTARKTEEKEANEAEKAKAKEERAKAREEKKKLAEEERAKRIEEREKAKEGGGEGV
jgi:hypothetical protein